MAMKMRHYRDRNFHPHHSDESSLVSLIQRVCRREDDVDRRLLAAGQLRESIMKPDTRTFLMKNMEQILNSLIDVFFERSEVALQKDVARIISLIGNKCSNDPCPFFHWFLAQMQGIANDNVRNYLLDSFLLLLTMDPEERKYTKVIVMMMDELQVILENIDSPEHLPVCIKPLILIAQNYPVAFRKHFRDTVDILVGWHIDHTQKMSLTLFASDSLVKLHTHWLNDIQFSLTLLSQFLEDMEVFAEDNEKLVIKDESVAMQHTFLSKIAALQRVFSTVVRSIGPVFNCSQKPITENFLQDALHRIINTSKQAGSYSRAVVRTADECARLLIGAIAWRNEMVSDTLLEYAVFTVEKAADEPQLLHALDFVIVMVQEIGAALPDWFIKGLLLPDARLLTLKLSRNKVYCSELLALCQSCLTVKSVPLLQTAYLHIAGEFQEVINLLLLMHHGSDEYDKLTVIKDNPFAGKITVRTDVVKSSRKGVNLGVVKGRHEAALLKTALFNIVSLLELADAKSSLIGMYAVSPNIFELFHNALLVTRKKLAAIYPSLQYAILQALYSHCQRRKNFTRSYIGEVNNSLNDPVDDATRATQRHYPAILELLSSFLLDKSVSFDCRKLLLHWGREILERLKSIKDTKLLEAPGFSHLIYAIAVAGLQNVPTHSLQSAKCLLVTQQLLSVVSSTTFGSENLTKQHLQQASFTTVYDLITKCCFTQLWNVNRSVRNAFAGNQSDACLLNSIPVDKIFSVMNESLTSGAPVISSKKPSNQRQLMLYGLQKSWYAKRIVNSSADSRCSFHAHHFKDLIDRIIKPNAGGNTFSGEWLEQLYWSCQRHVPNQQYNGGSGTLHTSDESFLFWWALWKAAEFTIANKLRTPLGKPQDTLTRIEAAIRDYERKLLASHTGGPVHTTNFRHGKLPRMAVYASWSSLQHPHLMLQFFGNLEKLLYNACEGSAVSIPPQAKTIKTFFYTNRLTCDQWLNRLRLPLMRIGLNCGLPAFTFQNGEAVLQDMAMRNNTSGFEFESAVAMLVEALVELESPHAIEGVYRWCRNLAGQNKKQHWAWIRGAKMFASGSYEDALREFQAPLAAALRKHSNSGGASSESGDASKVNDSSNSLPGGANVNVKKTFSPARSFVIQQTIKCYTNLNRFKDAQEWLESVPKDDYQTSYLNNANYLEALNNFGVGEFKATSESCHKLIVGGVSTASSVGASGVGGKLNGGHLPCYEMGGFSHPWNWIDLQCACELQTINYATKLKQTGEHESSLANAHLQQVIESSLGCIKLQSSHKPGSIPCGFQTIYSLASSVKKAMNQEHKYLNLPISSNIEEGSWLNTSAANLLMSSMDHLIDESCAKAKKSRSSLRMAMIKANRRNGNYNRAYRLLCDEFAGHDVRPKLDDEDVSELVNVCTQLVPEKHAFKLGPLHLQCESAKLMYATGKSTDGIILLADSLSTYLDNAGKSKSEVCCRGLLHLASYMLAEWKTVGPKITDLLGPSSAQDSGFLSKLKIIMKIEKKSPHMSFASNEDLTAEVGQEIILGSLFNLATLQAPDLAKSWFAMAGWCYKWGRKTNDVANSMGYVELLEEERQEVQAILQPLTSKEEYIEEVYSVLKHSHCCTVVTQAEGDALDENSTQQQNGSSGFAVMDQKTAAAITSLKSSSLSFKNVNEAVLEQFTSRCGPWLSHAPNHITQSLIAVRHRVCARIFNQLQLAAEAYFKFLRLNACQQVLKYEDGNVTATLRLLRLLVKHALELQSTLEEGFATTPTDPWKGIIPQLFSRLNHPELNVRRSITNLLSRMATQSPHLIIYPVVVATTRLDPRKHSAALRTSLDEHEVDDFEDSPENSLVKGPTKVEGNDGEGVTGHCYSQVLQSLIQQDEKKVQDVQLLVLELRRITLLWDELWLGTLNQHQQDIMKRLQQLHDEAKRVNNNAGLSKMEKQSILQKQREAIMRPVVYAMKRVYQITCADPETPHEQWFAELVQPLVESALEKLMNPPNPNNPRSCWSGFKQLHSFLETRSAKRTSHALNLDDISPKLMALKSTTVPIPGVTDSSNGLSIEGFSHVVTILPTKTKPKKLQFIGSDGRRYNYLFKGLEDLHLDERIMQFLSIANHLLRRQHGKRGYVARHYAVTPLGPRSGLIQWVTNATPLFALYKRWQQRQATIQANKVAQQQGNNNIPNIQVLRPSDLFYNKLNAAVKKAGVDIDRMSRRDWPKNILRSVFDELSAETPGDLLHREIWCSSTSADEFWSMQQKYTQSTAVMSMIGYVLGLGDRHLDNVLIDLESGEVVHIDYNVCFEKGLQLRVPERVPFRLTKNLVQAFGVAGVQGVFRNSCEQVMQTLRKGRETLLTLLEAFIYDPLVDWTGTVEGGYAGAVYGGGGQQQASKQHKDSDKLSKKEMDREITRSLFSSRVAEMKQGWYNNRDEMMKTLPMLIGELSNYQSHLSNNQRMHAKIQSLLEVKSHVKEALTSSRHPYRTLPQRWVQYQQQQTKKENVLNNLQNKILSCDECCKRYSSLLVVLSSHQLKALECERSTKIELGPCPFRQSFKFLQSAGQANSVSQANSTEKELMVLCEDRRVSMKSCLDALNSYAAIAAHFPPRAAIYQHREAIWSARLSRVCDLMLKNDYKKLACEVDTWRSKEFLAAQARAASSTDASLKKEVESLNNELGKLFKRRENEDLSGNEAEITLKKHRGEIFTFVQTTGNEGWIAFTYALSQTISSLNEQAIKMEKHVSNAGHRLVDQTSQEGDWFLEELSGLFANASQLLQVNGRICEDIKLRETTKSVVCVEQVFRSLLELYNNFRNIIVPETSKLLLQAEEASAIKLVSDFNGLLQGVRPDDLMKQLTNCLRLRGHQNGSKQLSLEAVLKEVEILQIKYRRLVNESERATPKTSGDMLLQAFHGLFHAVWASFHNLLVTRRDFHKSNDVTTQGWAAADVLQEASGLQKLKHLSDNLRLVQALMFVKQIQAMHTFFALAQHNAKFICVKRVPYSDEITGHQIVPNKQFYPEERLCKPIKFFVAFFVQELLVGLPTESLAYTTCAYLEILGVNIERYALMQGGGKVNTEKACKVALDTHHSAQVGNVQVLGDASMLLYNFNHHWKAFDRIKRLGANYDSTEASLNRAQLQVTLFQWLHEDLLDNNSMIFGAPRRSPMINDLNKRIITLSNRDRSIYQLKEKMKAQHLAIQQRLRWAAGANPTLQTVLKTVDSEVGKRETFLGSEENLSRNIMEICEDALAFERNRLLGSGGKENHSRDVSTDDDYMRLVSQAQNLCVASSTTTVKVNDLEQTIVEVLSPKPGANTEDWLHKVTEKISSSVAQKKVQRQQEEMKMSAVKSNLRDNVSVVKQLLSNHSRLLSDVKTLLKTMAREEEGAEGNNSKSSSLVNGGDGGTDNEPTTNGGNGQVGSVRRYMDSYKEVTSLLNDTLGEIVQRCDIATMLYPEPLINSLKDILGQMCGLYDGLVAFAAPNFDLSNDSNHLTFASALRSGNGNNRSSPASFKRNGSGVLHSHASNNGLDLLCGVDRTSTEDNGGGVGSSELNGGSAALLTKMTPSVVTSGVTQTPRKKPRDPKTGKAIQERNNTALSVWRKVKLKLDGKDIETGKRTQVTEQVEQIVSEAMDPDNLSLLYEGWTAWV